MEYIEFNNAKVGDFLECTRVYKQSKKYTIGNQYKIIKIEMIYLLQKHKDIPYLVIRDDKNKLTRINQIEGVSFTHFNLITK